jgi:hypothetical protein
MYLIALLFFVSIICIWGQCPTGIYPKFEFQFQIDNFGENYPDCDSIYEINIDDRNGTIINLNGLSGIRYIEYSLNITNLWNLPNLKGLDSITHIGGDLTITLNNSLTSLEGLNLTAVPEFLLINFNKRLKNFAGLEKLESVRVIDISYNDSLCNFQGLNHLHATDYLEIKYNAQLETLDGLNNYLNVNSSVQIEHNPKLSDCDLLFLCNHVRDSTKISSIAFNGTSCNSVQDVISGCDPDYSSATGLVYFDLNCNEIFDSADVQAPYHILQKTGNQFPVASTNSAGVFQLDLLKNDTLEIQVEPINHFSSNPFSYTFMTDTSLVSFDSIDFALCPDTLFHDLGVSLTAYSLPRPGFSFRYQVCVVNNGLYPDGGILVLDLSDLPGSQYVTIQSAEGGAVINGNTVTWNIPEVPLFTTLCFIVELKIKSDAPLGTVLVSHLKVTPIGPITEVNLLNNEVTLSQIVVGSHDPNAKMVDKDKVDFTDQEIPLEFTIRFQNTGSFPAGFIEITDTLEHELNMRSLEMIASSHPYVLSFPDTNIIKWRFEDINLPDSISDELESHGFVKFKINTTGFLDPNTIIRNSATIYFDFNASVITNSTSTLVDLQIKTNDPLEILDHVTVNPNPTTGSFLLVFDLKEKSKGRIELSNSQGSTFFRKEVSDFPEGHSSIPLNLDYMPEGIYFLSLFTNSGMITKKVIFIR